MTKIYSCICWKEWVLIYITAFKCIQFRTSIQDSWFICIRLSFFIEFVLVGSSLTLNKIKPFRRLFETSFVSAFHILISLINCSCLFIKVYKSGSLLFSWIALSFSCSFSGFFMIKALCPKLPHFHFVVLLKVNCLINSVS